MNEAVTKRPKFILCRNCGFGCGTNERGRWGVTDESGFPSFGFFCCYSCSHAADLSILRSHLKDDCTFALPNLGDDQVLDALYAYFCKSHLRSAWMTPSAATASKFECWLKPPTTDKSQAQFFLHTVTKVVREVEQEIASSPQS